MKVYSPQQNYKLAKILMASKIYQKDLTVQKVDFNPHISKSFKQAYPQYTLPLLQTKEGKFITGTNTILIFISGQPNLTNKVEKAKIIQQLQKIERGIDSATGILILHIKGHTQVTQGQIQKSKQILTKYIQEQNENLALKTFLTGDRLTVADISAYYNISAVKELFDKQIPKLKNLGRWMKHIESMENV